MNLVALAEKDLAFTLGNSLTGGAVDFTVLKPSGVGIKVSGLVGDIGYLLDTEGNPIAGRTVVASYPMASLLDDKGDYVTPGNGWHVIYSDLKNHEWILNVTRAEPDRSLGIMRLILSLILDKSEANKVNNAKNVEGL